MKAKVLILGVGNVLMGDEGVGVHVARELAASPWPEGVVVLDGGTGGFHLMEHLEQADQVVMIDATLDKRPAGTVRRLHPRFAAEFPKALSSHDIGLRDLLEGLTILGRLPEIFLYAVSIDAIQSQTIELSDPLQAIVPELCREIREFTLSMIEDPAFCCDQHMDPIDPEEGRLYASHRVRMDHLDDR
ncbi:MAG: hydrogenase maturation protease [Lewinellaceae bacterium]|nr:hydrogenase maturation protease [Saprospiraceae bacterium]MCB9314313.1 hydrogenase maturation protease [Lewinellaceae bacterium]HRW74735.1 hydrogenase maturation protease [Saprospiraceae bacterium]